MRKTKQIFIDDTNLFKKQLLSWAQYSSDVIWLDSNKYSNQYSSFDAVLALDANSSLTTDFTSAFDKLNNYKLKKAKHLLKTSTQNVSEIAYNLGFNSPNYFSTVFRNKYGYTPIKYRKDIKKLFTRIEV